MTEETALVTQGSVATTAVAFLHLAVLRMIPYSVPAVVLLLLDLVYGVRGARFRGEKVRLSTAIRRTLTKAFTYICWIILASTIGIAFNQNWLEWGVLGLVYLNEFASIVSNYLDTKGIDFSILNLWRLIIRKGADKVGVEVSKEEAAELITEKPKKNGKRNS